jgi:hypothetical protein
MKKINGIALLLTMIVLGFTSCKKDVEDRLPGDWNGTFTMSEVSKTTENAITTTETDSESLLTKLTFNENGTGIMTLDSEMLAFSWTANEDNDEVTLILQDEPLIFKVTTNEKDEQEWSATEEEFFEEEDYSVQYTTTYNLKMTKTK